MAERVIDAGEPSKDVLLHIYFLVGNSNTVSCYLMFYLRLRVEITEEGRRLRHIDVGWTAERSDRRTFWLRAILRHTHVGIFGSRTSATCPRPDCLTHLGKFLRGSDHVFAMNDLFLGANDQNFYRTLTSLFRFKRRIGLLIWRLRLRFGLGLHLLRILESIMNVFEFGFDEALVKFEEVLWILEVDFLGLVYI